MPIESPLFPLFLPVRRDRSGELRLGEAVRLTAIEDRLDDIWGEDGKPEQAAHDGGLDSQRLRHFANGPILPGVEEFLPDVGTGDGYVLVIVAYRSLFFSSYNNLDFLELPSASQIALSININHAYI